MTENFIKSTDENKNLIYSLTDKIPLKKMIIYALQQVLAVITATLLIANICGTPISSCLFGACLGTLVYQFITKGRSPIFISSCGATAGATIATLANGGYSAVVIGGLTILTIYYGMALIIHKYGIEKFNSFFTPTIIGATTMVIGINLADFIPGYVDSYGTMGMLIACLTMFVIALSAHYCRGFGRTIPFLIGILTTYFLCLFLTLTNIYPLVDLSYFKDLSLLSMPDFAFFHFEKITYGQFLSAIFLFAPVAIVALLEHYSDHNVLSNMIGRDLTKDPGLVSTLLGDGTASFLGTLFCGLANTSYGESIATIGFSRVASRKVITLAALFLGILSFLTPVQAFIQSIPSCIFGGAAMILYGYIIASGLKTIINHKVDLNNNKNLIITSVILTVGTSGIYLGTPVFAGVSLAMILGVALNLILK